MPDDKAILVGVEIKSQKGSWTIRDSLDELGRLARTAGLTVAGRTWQKLPRPDASTWIGSGKVREIAGLIAAEDAQYVLFDDELSPGQQRNLEEAFGEGVRVIDRTRLILDIFSLNARSREGKLQVELAQYQYLLPRLAGMRRGLAQQVGGSGAGPVGLRGPGETQLEMDRRQARRRITVVRRALEEVRTQRRQHRRQRVRAGLPVVALVGYTNAGKSSLLNALTGAAVLVQDRLFSTLDPTTRRLILPGGREALLTDTVGFIRKLPHELVAAFRATLEGIEEASLILHVVDGSHPHASEQVAAVQSVLSSLSVADTPLVMVWNKMDLLPDRSLPQPKGTMHHESVAISAKTGENIPALLTDIEQILSERLRDMRLLIPYDRYELVAELYEQGTVWSKEEAPEGVRVKASIPLALAERLAAFALSEKQHHRGAKR
ncbi:MAG TPA: GTPase HflX [Spirochaetia bacterium]|nr:GTPase HflX [Spirochaetia bacterium]